VGVEVSNSEPMQCFEGLTLVPFGRQDEEVLITIIRLSLGVDLLADPEELKLGLAVELVSAAALAVLDVIFVRRVKDLVDNEDLFVDYDSDLRRQVEKAEGRYGLDGHTD
jgi:hypothetical protein